VCVAVTEARFSGTILYAGEVVENGSAIHVLGYENTVQNLAAPAGRFLERWAARDEPRGNAMVLHFPAVPGTMSQANVVDTEGCPRILRDMVDALEPADTMFAWRLQTASAAAPVEVFESGIYTVVLALDARAIPVALHRVPKKKRPPLNDRLFDWYADAFPAWPIALCCFNTAQAAKATPMLWWYEPLAPGRLFAPAIDCHTGDIPDLGARVDVDHWVIFGASELEGGAEVDYSDPIPDDVARYLPTRVVGAEVRRRMPNADFVADTEDIRRANLDLRREVLAAA
jgi:hypothetical protein